MTLQHESEVPRHFFDEHARLRDLLEEIRIALTAGAAGSDTVVPLIEELVQNVLDHFEHEERGGYFSGVLEIAPRLSLRVSALLSQHLEMAAQLVALQKYAEGRNDNDRWSRQLNELFSRFFERFRAHEAAENLLLQEAYSDDIGAED